MSFDSIYIVYLTILLIITIVGFTRYKSLNKGFRVLTILILCTLISESIKKVYGKVYHNNMPVAHIWGVAEFALYSATFYYLLNNSKIRKAIVVAVALMTALEIWNVLFFENLLQFPSLILNISQIVYVLYSLLLFRQMLLVPAEQSLFKQSLFWFNLNMLFYGTTMFLNFALTSYFIQNKLDMTALYYFSIVVNFIFYILIGISILIDNKKANMMNTSNGK